MTSNALSNEWNWNIEFVFDIYSPLWITNNCHLAVRQMHIIHAFPHLQSPHMSIIIKCCVRSHGRFQYSGFYGDKKEKTERRNELTSITENALLCTRGRRLSSFLLSFRLNWSSIPFHFPPKSKSLWTSFLLWSSIQCAPHFIYFMDVSILINKKIEKCEKNWNVSMCNFITWSTADLCLMRVTKTEAKMKFKAKFSGEKRDRGASKLNMRAAILFSFFLFNHTTQHFISLISILS